MDAPVKDSVVAAVSPGPCPGCAQEILVLVTANVDVVGAGFRVRVDRVRICGCGVFERPDTPGTP